MAILETAVNDQTYPGATAIVGDAEGNVFFRAAVGNYSYQPNSTPMQVKTLFDIASLTKVVSTTSAVALLYQEGYFRLDTRVVDILGSGFANGGKDEITILNCLLHNAGLQPDPDPWYWDETFECPNTNDIYPTQDFSCIERIYQSLLQETLVTTPGETYVYSDLSFITLQMVVGTIVLQNNLVERKQVASCLMQQTSFLPVKASLQDSITQINTTSQEIVCSFKLYVEQNVFNGRTLPEHGTYTNTTNAPISWMPNTTYLPFKETWQYCAPTLNDTGPESYTHRRLQGQVADGDCYAMGGIAGHAGVFSTADDLGMFMSYMLQQKRRAYGRDQGKLRPDNGERLFWDVNTFALNSTTVALFTSVYNVSQSSRALGWTTNNMLVEDFGYDHSCGDMAADTFMHIGYTGTCVCADPVNNVYSVILTNRIYNCDGQLCPAGSSDAVKSVYRKFNSALASFVRNRVSGR